MAWAVRSTATYDEWQATLTDEEQAEVLAKVVLLRNNGPSLSRPHADTLRGSMYANMKELRATTATAQLRVAFAFDPARNAILLCGGEKQGVDQRRFYKRLTALADRLYAAHLHALKKGRTHG